MKIQPLFFISLLIPSLAFAGTASEQIRSFRDSYEGFKYTQDRMDRFVFACLQTYDNTGRNYNDQWHQELEGKAIQCAERLIKKLDEYDYGKQESTSNGK